MFEAPCTTLTLHELQKMCSNQRMLSFKSHWPVLHTFILPGQHKLLKAAKEYDSRDSSTYARRYCINLRENEFLTCISHRNRNENIVSNTFFFGLTRKRKETRALVPQT